MEKLWSFIPHKIHNSHMIRILDMFCKVPSMASGRNLLHNQSAFGNHQKTIARNKGYIEDQNHYRDLRFGRTSVRFSGCEVIAVYNALVDLSQDFSSDIPFSFPELLHIFEKKGIIFSGIFGTSPKMLERFLKSLGLGVTMSVHEKDFERIANDHDYLLYTFYNDKNDIRAQIHTVYISNKKGTYTVHNLYGNGERPDSCSSFHQLCSRINHGKSKGISMIGILKD